MKKILDSPILVERRQAVENVGQELKKRGLDPESFCVMPFVSLLLEPNGNVGMCRHKGTEFPIGNIKDSPIDQIWNNEMAQKWRREFLEGKVEICSDEVRHRHCNLCPEMNKILPDAELSVLQEGPVLRLAANFNGKCNLQCQMCHVWQMPNGLYDEINFWEPAEKNIFPHLKEIDLLSGEPFIQKDTFRLIDIMSRVNPDCLWTFTTNAHWRLSDEIKSDLDKINIKNIILSVDSLDTETYHKIRYPGQLKIVLKNIDDLLEYQSERESKGLSSLNLNFNFLIQRDNWKEAEAAIDYCLSKEILPFITYLYEPTQFSLDTLPTEERLEIIDFYLKTMDWGKLSLLLRVIRPLIDGLPALLKGDCLMRLQKSKLAYEKQSK